LARSHSTSQSGRETVRCTLRRAVSFFMDRSPFPHPLPC
jgi:hypothetical protein